tara:strand:- start:378 stop:815 length:438 start_codon:yes stop_codon:yes gene_type:complete
MIVTDEVLITAVHPKDVDKIWGKIAPLIEKAMEYSNGEHDIADIHYKIMNKNMLLLNITEGKDMTVAAVTLEMTTFPSGKKVLTIVTCGGSDMHLWLDKMLETSEGIAADAGCEDVYVVGRGGWQRQLKSNGYGLVHTVLKKTVR